MRPLTSNMPIYSKIWPILHRSATVFARLDQNLSWAMPIAFCVQLPIIWRRNARASRNQKQKQRSEIMKQQFALSLLALSLFIGASPVLADAPAPPTISVLTAEKKPIDEQLNVTGSFAAGEMVLVTPE